MLKTILSVVGVLVAVGGSYGLRMSAHSSTGACDPIDVQYAKVTYTDPMPFFDVNGNVVNFGPRELGSKATIECYPGFSLHNYVNLVCGEDAKWSTEERPTCEPQWSKMQVFVFFAFASIPVMLVIELWQARSEWNRIDLSASRGSILQHAELIPSHDGVISEHKMGNHAALMLTFETFTLFFGFSCHFFMFLEDGIWYLNPAERTMINPGQKTVSAHVFLGFFVCLAMLGMAGLIKFEKKHTKGPLRKTHRILGQWVIPPVAVLFLSSAVWAELQLPGNISQKIARNMLTLWVAMVLFFLINHAWERNIRAHLHYVVCFWGLVCSAGALRGMALVWGHLLGCEFGYIANPTLGIVTGTLFSTLFPMLAFVHLNGTWNQSYARWCIFFASYYQLLIPLYFKHFLRPCYPRMNMATVYPDYRFPMPREFYDTEESYMEAFMQLAGSL